MSELIRLEWFFPLLAAPFIGSFLGLLIRRLPAGQGVVLGRSACPDCAHPLGVRDLLPLVSFALSGGRCRHCKSPISRLYPAVEIAAIVIALWAALMLSGWLVWAGCALGWALLALAAIDQEHMLLPDPLTLPLIPAGLLVAYALDPRLLVPHAIGAGTGFAAFALIGWAYKALRGRAGLGLGDAKLLAGAGAWLSWQGLPSVVLIAAVAALLVLLARSFAGRLISPTTPVPFGPYLCLGTWLVWLYGPLIPA